MSSGIPIYNQACLATDSTSSVPSFYLVGSTSPGSLEVNYINNTDATTYTRVASKNDQSAWTPNAAKLCYICPFATTVNPGINVIQFGSGSTYIALAQTNNIVSAPTSFQNTGFISPKFFSWSGKFQDFDMFTVVTNDTDVRTGRPGVWAGLRLNFRETGSTLLDYDVGNDPIVVSDAMLSVGTYGEYAGSTSPGFTIVFDKSNRGQIFSTEGSLLADVNNSIPAVALGTPISVNMNGIALTENAIPITMGNTAYILDKASNGTTVIYSINPGASTILNRIYKTGDSLLFTNNMAASALNNQILTYSINKNVAYFNVFDVSSGTWSGNGLVSGATVDVPPPSSSKSSNPIGVIVGGAVGGFLVIALALFFFVRYRRQSALKSGNVAELAQASPEANKFDGAGQGHVQQYDPGYTQYDQAQSPYVQAQVQYDPNQVQYSQEGQAQYGLAHAQPDQGYVRYEQQAYQRPSPFIPPPPPVNQDADVSYKVYQPKSLQAMANIDASYEVPHSELTEDSIYSPTVVNSSPYISPASYRDSFQPGSPESVRAKVLSGTAQGPQFVPNTPVAVTEARSPQVVPSTIIGH
ncbi:hypothetical protein BGZ96_000959 [Linnemannia gamsii]|uniref:Peptidase A1 domain-containing protein n=1 Tax=Linnemannia gamsii TaxID=64522 RepID=A0ABQ7JNQ1_9FUNG|nr:hypothetical protein BGZ96_000959 [Linnemannia gamsii]